MPITRLFLLRLAPLTLIASGLLAQPVSAGVKPPIQIVVLAGQSNMVGFAKPIPAETPSPRVLKVLPSGRMIPAVDPVFTYDPVYDGTLQPGASPGYSFAQYLAAHNKKLRIALVPCAASGTRIDEWQRGQPLYDSCVAMVRAAVKRGGKFAGVLFFQGENDTQSPDTVAAWPAKFATFASTNRADLGAPKAPLVYAQIATPPPTAEWDRFREMWLAMQATQAATMGSVSHTEMITTSDLPYGVDDASASHFGPTEVQTIGGRFATAWLRLRPTSLAKR